MSLRPLMTVNGDHIISAVLRLCGGRNVFSWVRGFMEAPSAAIAMLLNCSGGSFGGGSSRIVVLERVHDNIPLPVALKGCDTSVSPSSGGGGVSIRNYGSWVGEVYSQLSCGQKTFNHAPAPWVSAFSSAPSRHTSSSQAIWFFGVVLELSIFDLLFEWPYRKTRHAIACCYICNTENTHLGVDVNPRGVAAPYPGGTAIFTLGG